MFLLFLDQNVFHSWFAYSVYKMYTKIENVYKKKLVLKVAHFAPVCTTRRKTAGIKEKMNYIFYDAFHSCFDAK